MGGLTLVPTPIGNLDDITIRALNTLREADAILCEDTRHTMKLIKHHDVSNKLIAFHQHNEHKITERLVEEMKAGTNYALVSDAGTPGISDPGYLLSRACIEADVQVTVLPGPTAVIPAVVGSGMACEKYVYLGFPPQKKGRQTFWSTLSEETRTMVMYESPHRIAKALREAAEIFGEDRNACVARELSKIHETYHRGSLSELKAHAESTPFKGEIVLVIEGLAQFEKRTKKKD